MSERSDVEATDTACTTPESQQGSIRFVNLVSANTTTKAVKVSAACRVVSKVNQEED